MDINTQKSLDNTLLLQYNSFCSHGVSLREVDWVWRSLVACLNGVQEAGGSNPLTQTSKKALITLSFQGVLLFFQIHKTTLKYAKISVYYHTLLPHF